MYFGEKANGKKCYLISRLNYSYEKIPPIFLNFIALKSWSFLYEILT